MKKPEESSGRESAKENTQYAYICDRSNQLADFKLIAGSDNFEEVPEMAMGKEILQVALKLIANVCECTTE